MLKCIPLRVCKIYLFEGLFLNIFFLIITISKYLKTAKQYAINKWNSSLCIEKYAAICGM
jgi:hypothetical protein